MRWDQVHRLPSRSLLPGRNLVHVCLQPYWLGGRESHALLISTRCRPRGFAKMELWESTMREGSSSTAKVLHAALCARLSGFWGRRASFELTFLHFFQLALKCGMCPCRIENCALLILVLHVWWSHLYGVWFAPVLTVPTQALETLGRCSHLLVFRPPLSPKSSGDYTSEHSQKPVQDNQPHI